MIRYITRFLFAAVLATGMTHADEIAQPKELINDTFEVVKQKVDAAGIESIQSEPKIAIEIVEEHILPLINSKLFTKQVMGVYFGKSTKEQKYAFLDKMQESFVKTYATSLAKVGNVNYSLKEISQDDKKAKLRMLVETEGTDTVPVDFSFVFNKKEKIWQVANLELAGINLGLALKDKFSNLMQEYKDIDLVIENWSSGVPSGE